MPKDYDFNKLKISPLEVSLLVPKGEKMEEKERAEAESKYTTIIESRNSFLVTAAVVMVLGLFCAALLFHGNYVAGLVVGGCTVPPGWLMWKLLKDHMVNLTRYNELCERLAEKYGTQTF